MLILGFITSPWQWNFWQYGIPPAVDQPEAGGGGRLPRHFLHGAGEMAGAASEVYIYSERWN